MKRPPGISSKLLVGGSVSWRYKFKHGKEPDGRDRYVSKAGFATMREAIEAMTREKARLGKPSTSSTGDVTFGEFFLQWLDYRAGYWSPKTREENRRHANQAISRFGHIPLSKITPEILDLERNYLLAHGRRSGGTAAGPLSPKSVNETFILVKAALRQAKRWNRISVDPGADLQLSKLRRRQIQVPQEDQLKALFESVANTRYYAMLVFATDSGCRRGEILALKISDIDWKTGEVTVSKSVEETKAGLRIKATKSERPRSFTVSPTTLTILREHLARIDHERDRLGSNYAANDLLFPTPEGNYYKPDQVSGRVREFMKRAGLQGSFHSLRHFVASYLLSQGASLPAVSERLGHANPSITLGIYSHVMRTDDALAAKAIDAGLAKVVVNGRKTLRPVLVTLGDTDDPKTGTGH